MGSRDKNGIRPLVMGKKDDSYIFTSETIVLQTLGYEFIGEGKECLYLDPEGKNLGFLPESEDNNLIRVTKYEDFKLKIFKLMNKERLNKVLEKKDNYCLKSDKVSENIINTLRRLN